MSEDRMPQPEDGPDYHAELAAWKERNPNSKEIRTPYPWCSGYPTRLACSQAGFCKKNPNCGE